MGYIGLGLFAAALLVGGWYLSRLISGTSPNEGSTHGGGYDGTPTENH
jgi:hypothetical protein